MERVVVAGGGLLAPVAALAIRRALPHAAVTLVGTPLDPGDLAERLPVVFPAARAALEGIGLDGEDLVTAGLANHRLADRFTDWGTAQPWLHAFGEPGGSVGPGPFHQLWLQAKRGGQSAPYHAYLPAAALAEAGRYDTASSGTSPMLARVDGALRLHGSGVTTVLARRLSAARISCPAALLSRPEAAIDGTLAAAVLADGTKVPADLFVDCTGPAARLLGALGGAWEGWADAVGCDRLLLAEEAPRAALLDDYRAGEIGWQAQVSLPDRTVAYTAWIGDLAADGRARRVSGFGARGEPVAFRPGRRSAPWVGNVIALGGAAAEPGPILTAGFSLALWSLLLLLELLPGCPIVEGERREYNRRAAAVADRVRDLAALPVIAAARRRGEAWRRTAAPPRSLAAILTQFRARGLLPRPEEDLVEPETWLALLLGLGIVPERANPVAAGADPVALRLALDRLAGAVAALPANLPPYGVPR